MGEELCTALRAGLQELTSLNQGLQPALTKATDLEWLFFPLSGQVV